MNNQVSMKAEDAFEILKKLMTKVWEAGAGRLSVAVCVDEAIRIARSQGMDIPVEWRERIIAGANEVLEAREKPGEDLPVVIANTTQAEFEAELKKHQRGTLKVVKRS